MLDIVKRLAGAQKATAADLKKALSEIDLDALAAAVASAETERREALLAGNETRLERAEETLATARRDHERAATIREAYTAKIAETENAEAISKLSAERTELEREAEAVSRELAKVYPKASREIVAIFEKLEATEARVAAFNQKIETYAVAPVTPPEERAFPTPPGNLKGAFSVLLATELRPCGGSPGWGEFRRRVEVAGIKL